MQPEPTEFRKKVYLPGRKFLREHPRPTAKQWKGRAYWTKVLKELHSAYRGICAYSCHWIPYDTGHDTVEHFLPKSAFPCKAYDWSNYRLVCGTLNGRKGTDCNIIDPFTAQDGWFVLDFPSLLVKPNQSLSQDIIDKILHTIERLGLNDEGTCVAARLRYVKCYCTNVINFDFLTDEAPFLAQEIQRQGLRNSLNRLMGY
jgi:hypothetical protein